MLNHAVNYSESGVSERRRNNSEQRHEAKLTRVVERRRNTRQITQKTTDFPKFKIRASRCCAACAFMQGTSHDQGITGEINRVCVFKQSGKMWLIP